jgi:hypothetical protein
MCHRIASAAQWALPKGVRLNIDPTTVIATQAGIQTVYGAASTASFASIEGVPACAGMKEVLHVS